MQPVADLLSIPKDHIYANRLLFTEGGEHAGFDSSEYTARSGGKAKAVEEIKKVGVVVSAEFVSMLVRASAEYLLP